MSKILDMATTADSPVARTGLRSLSATEEGTSIDRLPAGVIGYTYAPLTESPVFSKRDYHCFEMQKLADGSVRFIAWVTPAEAERIRAARDQFDLYVYPDPWKDATVEIALPVERCTRRNRNPIREEGNRLGITVYPA